MLRHAFATELLRTGANLEEVRRLMGHRSILTTSRYTHPDGRALRAAVDRLSRKRRGSGAAGGAGPVASDDEESGK